MIGIHTSELNIFMTRFAECPTSVPVRLRFVATSRCGAEPFRDFAPCKGPVVLGQQDSFAIGAGPSRPSSHSPSIAAPGHLNAAPRDIRLERVPQKPPARHLEQASPVWTLIVRGRDALRSISGTSPTVRDTDRLVDLNILSPADRFVFPKLSDLGRVHTH